MKRLALILIFAAGTALAQSAPDRPSPQETVEAVQQQLGAQAWTITMLEAQVKHLQAEAMKAEAAKAKTKAPDKP